MCTNLKFPADLLTFTEEILNGKLDFLCSASKTLKISKMFWEIPATEFRAISIFAFHSNFTHNTKTNDFIKFFMIL